MVEILPRKAPVTISSFHGMHLGTETGTLGSVDVSLPPSGKGMLRRQLAEWRFRYVPRNHRAGAQKVADLISEATKGSAKAAADGVARE